MKNKDLLDKLEKYFLEKCDPKIVARFLGGLLIDFNRIQNYENLDIEEKHSLITRIKHNSDEIVKFAKNENLDLLKYKKYNHDED